MYTKAGLIGCLRDNESGGGCFFSFMLLNITKNTLTHGVLYTTNSTNTKNHISTKALPNATNLWEKQDVHQILYYCSVSVTKIEVHLVKK